MTYHEALMLLQKGAIIANCHCGFWFITKPNTRRVIHDHGPDGVSYSMELLPPEDFKKVLTPREAR